MSDPTTECFSESQTGTTSDDRKRWVKGNLIGSGSWGSIYLGLVPETGDLIAVRRIELAHENEDREIGITMSDLLALEEKIKGLKELKHANIVAYHFTSMASNTLEIGMDYVAGGSVFHLLGTYGAFEEHLTRTVIKGTLEGLVYLHKRDIVLGNLKSSNILLDNRGLARIGDIGMGRPPIGLASSTMEPSLSLIPPEHFPDEVLVHSSKADIWSLGCLAVEMLTEKVVWSGISRDDALSHLRRGKGPMIAISDSDISTDLRDFLQNAFIADPSMRPTALELTQHGWLRAVSDAQLGSESD